MSRVPTDLYICCFVVGILHIMNCGTSLCPGDPLCIRNLRYDLHLTCNMRTLVAHASREAFPVVGLQKTCNSKTLAKLCYTKGWAQQHGIDAALLRVCCLDELPSIVSMLCMEGPWRRAPLNKNHAWKRHRNLELPVCGNVNSGLSEHARKAIQISMGNPTQCK